VRRVVAIVVCACAVACGGPTTPSSLAPEIKLFVLSPAVGVAAVSRVGVGSLDVDHNEVTPASFLLDFGDGTIIPYSFTRGVERPSHVYATPGRYTATFTVINEKGKTGSRQASVEIKSLTGVWSVSSGAVALTLSQDGAALSGALVLSTGQVCDDLSGMARPLSASRPVTLSGACAAGSVEFYGGPATADQISGTLVIGGSSAVVRLNRQ
jgi:uncharacterized membrane protein